MSLQDGFNFCLSPWRGQKQVRAAVIRRFGFRHSGGLEAVVATATQTRAEYDALALTQCQRQNHFQTYLDFVGWVGRSPQNEFRHLTEDQLAQLVRGALHWSGKHFMVLKLSLASVNRAEVAIALQRSLHPDLTGASPQAWLCALSAWHEATLPQMVQGCCRCHKASFWRDRQEFETTTWRICLHVRGAAEGFAPANIDTDPLRWFVETCDAALVQRALLILLRACRAQNELVRTVADIHHAKSQCIRFLNFMKNGLLAVRPCLDLSAITARKLLREIPNQRTPADGASRRTLTLEEAERIIQAARGSNDARAPMLLVLLSEIGLRRSALCHLKYSNLLDRTHTPLCTGRAWEKGRKYRYFVTSTRLKQAIKGYAETIRDVADARSDGDFYLLNPQQPERPLSQDQVRNIVHIYTERAGITDVHVHPHMFRHSIVGWLVDAGNSMELASKYMGHTSVSTTAQHYWVPNTTELFSKINNPFTGEMQQQQRETRQAVQELELLQSKLDGALHIIAQMDAIVRTAVASNLTAPPVQEAMARIPNRDAILRTILESTSASLTATSMPPPEPLQGIAEDDKASQESEGSASSTEDEGEAQSDGGTADDAAEAAVADNKCSPPKRLRQ